MAVNVILSREMVGWGLAVKCALKSCVFDFERLENVALKLLQS